MKPPEPIIVFDCNFVGIAVARDGKVSIDGMLYSYGEIMEIVTHLEYLALSAKQQAEYENGQTKTKPLEK